MKYVRTNVRVLAQRYFACQCVYVCLCVCAHVRAQCVLVLVRSCMCTCVSACERASLCYVCV